MVTKSDLPPFQDYFVPTVRTMKSKGGSTTIEEMEEGVAKAMNLTEEILAVPHGDGPRTQFQYELAWVRTFLKKAGAAENSERAVWSLTDRGEALSEKEVRNIPVVVRAEDARKRKLRLSEEAESIEVEDADEPAWADVLLKVIQEMKPQAFERLAQRILRESGFTRVEVTGRSGDGGIDGIGTLRVNLVSFHVLFQCKKWKGGVGSKEVRDFRGAMIGRADKGIIVTTGHFTADAKQEAGRDGAPAIDLIDGDNLCNLLKELRLGVAVKQVEAVTVQPEFFQSI
jgi:restriction system protein